jgi:hypothetical protein
LNAHSHRIRCSTFDHLEDLALQIIDAAHIVAAVSGSGGVNGSGRSHR